VPQKGLGYNVFNVYKVLIMASNNNENKPKVIEERLMAAAPIRYQASPYAPNMMVSTRMLVLYEDHQLTRD